MLFRSEGIDFVDHRVQSAREFLNQEGYSTRDFSLYTADMNNMRNVIKDGSIDLLIAINVTMLKDDDISQFAKEIVRVLSSGGKAIIGTAFERSFSDSLKENGKVFLENGDRLIFIKNGKQSLGDVAPGGIDFNAKNINIEIQDSKVKSQNETQIPDTIFQNIDFTNIEGLVPVIINIVPITNFYQVMGLEPEGERIDQLSLK